LALLRAVSRPTDRPTLGHTAVLTEPSRGPHCSTHAAQPRATL
jgi:hypothetical protein